MSYFCNLVTYIKRCNDVKLQNVKDLWQVYTFTFLFVSKHAIIVIFSSLHQSASLIRQPKRCSKNLNIVKIISREKQFRQSTLGGGTPSMLPPSEIQTLIDGVKNLFSVDSELEITLEANPDNLTKPYLEELKKTDVNRFSIGIQSFHQDELLWMNRAHNSEEAKRCLELVESYQYDHYSVDLILGIPISSREKWQQNLDILSGFRPKHVSCYALTVEPKTALDYQIKNGKSPAIKDTETEEQFYMAHDFLSKKGYKHYEISNYGPSWICS